MVSPLQTWQHPESKRLWFILGGLSVLAHIGLLGLSLPYVLRLMEPSPATVSALPIELVTVDPVSGESLPSHDSDSLLAPASSARQPAPDTATSPPTDANGDSSLSPTAPSSFNNQVNNQVNNQAAATDPPTNANNSPETSSPETAGPETAGPEASSSPPPASDSQPSSRPTQTPIDPIETETGSGDRANNNSDSGSGDRANNGFNGSDDGLANNSDGGSSDTIPSITGNEQLQPPSSDGTSTTVQVAALRVTSTRIEAVQDVKEQPPQLLSSTAAIALEPERVGCDRIDFSSGPLGPLTYRVAINPDDSIRTLTLQTEAGNSSVSPENEAAIACLIRSAGFTFSAALSDGTPTLDDSLLLTLEVIESPTGTHTAGSESP